MKSSPLSRLLRYANSSKSQVWRAFAASILNKIFDLAPPLLIGMAVDVVVLKEQSWLASVGVPDPRQQMLVVAALTVVIWGLESIFEFLQKWWWRTLAQSMQHQLRIDAYSQTQRLDQSWFADHSTGHLMSVLNDDVNQLERFLDGGADALLQTITTMIVVSMVFFYVHPGVAVLAMLPIPIILWGSFTFTRKMEPLYASVREQTSRLNSQLSNNLGGIETIKSFTNEALEVERISRLSMDYQAANRDAIALSASFSPLIRMVIVVGFTATLVLGGFLALDGTLAVASYSVLVFLTQRLLWPLTRLGDVVDQYQRAMASTTRILDLVDTKPLIVDGDKELSWGEAAVSFLNVSFAYPGREPLLNNFSLALTPGKTTAIVGPTGSGKSTIVRLLLRLYDPQCGEITVDGQATQSVTLSSLREEIGLVSQGVYLFSGTIEENVRYGRLDGTTEQFNSAMSAAEANSFVELLPEGLNTVVGERGQKLSGGQSQRLSIARAILKDPKVLILDEATSAVDNETEAAIQRSLKRVSEGRTTLVIAHRLSTIRNAHKIIVMDHGEIVQTGSHDELLAVEDGLYSRLWRVQTGEG